MTDNFIQQKFKELIYEFGEYNFNIIKSESWDRYINRDEPFNEQQIQSLRGYLKELVFAVAKQRYIQESTKNEQ